MRVFITGGSGFIGGALIRRLRLGGYEVKALARSPRAEARIGEAGAIPVPGDLSRPGPWQDELRAGVAVVHSGAMVTDWGPRKEFFRINVGGTERVLDAVKGWTGHLIHLSSIAVHGFRPGVTTETSPMSPGRHPYCASKAAAEALVDSSVRNGLKASIVRISGAYGAGDPHFAARLLDQAASGRVYIVGSGDQPSKLIHIDDIVDALMAILERPCEPGSRYLLNDPSLPGVLGMVRLALEALGVSAPIRSVPEKMALAVALCQEGGARLTGSRPRLTRYAVKALGRRCLYSPEETCRKLGWSPRVKARDGVERTVAWYRKSRPDKPGSKA